jgi:glycosyltransferase involved in cell wall biosynthesis
MPQPSIAVITPVKNGRQYLRDAIDGVLGQQYPGLEIIVVDDGSTDGSAAIAKSMGCRVLESHGIGPAGARNAGIRASNADFLLFLDADDLQGSYSLKAVVDALLSEPAAGFAQGYIQNFRTEPNGSMHVFTKPYRFINLGSCLWRRSVFDTVGLFDESLRFGEDQDLFMRCWERDIQRVLMHSIMLHYRRHPGNMTRGLKGAEFGLVGLFKKRIERIGRGEYNPKVPRHVTWAEYLGESPAVGDLD